MTKTYPADTFLAALDTLKPELSSRPLWEDKGPKGTQIAYHGTAAVFLDGAPVGVVYVQVFKCVSSRETCGWDMALMAPGISIPAVKTWVLESVTRKVAT